AVGPRYRAVPLQLHSPTLHSNSKMIRRIRCLLLASLALAHFPSRRLHSAPRLAHVLAHPEHSPWNVQHQVRSRTLHWAAHTPLRAADTAWAGRRRPGAPTCLTHGSGADCP